MFDFRQAILSLEGERLFKNEWSGGSGNYIDNHYGHKVPFFYHTTFKKLVIWHVNYCEVCYCEAFREWNMCSHEDDYLLSDIEIHPQKEFKKDYVLKTLSNSLTLF